MTVLGNPNTLAKSGSDFLGWNTEATGDGTNYSEGTTFTMGSADVTLYARWVSTGTSTFDVTFNSNGGSAIATQTVVDGDPAVEPDPAPSRTGYSFDGWFSDSGLNTAYDFATPVTAATTLYAGWTANDYDVVFDANGGSGSMANQTITFDTSANLTTNSFTRTGYSFAGWNTGANGAGDSYADGANFTMGSADVTLYAQWDYEAITISNSSGSVTEVNYSGADSAYGMTGRTVQLIDNNENVIASGTTGSADFSFTERPDVNGFTAPSGVTVSDPDMQYAIFELDVTDGTNSIGIQLATYSIDGTTLTIESEIYFFVDRDVTISGSFTQDGETTYLGDGGAGLSLSAGWNRVRGIYVEDFSTTSGGETTLEDTSGAPAGAEWHVFP